MTVFEKFAPRSDRGPALSLAFAILSVAFLAAISFQTAQLLRDRSNLFTVYTG
jgi:hypothetical protein